MALSTLSGGELLRAMQDAERDWLDAERAVDIVREVAAAKKATYDELRDRLDLETGRRSACP